MRLLDDLQRCVASAAPPARSDRSQQCNGNRGRHTPAERRSRSLSQAATPRLRPHRANMYTTAGVAQQHNCESEGAHRRPKTPATPPATPPSTPPTTAPTGPAARSPAGAAVDTARHTLRTCCQRSRKRNGRWLRGSSASLVYERKHLVLPTNCVGRTALRWICSVAGYWFADNLPVLLVYRRVCKAGLELSNEGAFSIGGVPSVLFSREALKTVRRISSQFWFFIIVSPIKKSPRRCGGHDTRVIRVSKMVTEVS